MKPDPAQKPLRRISLPCRGRASGARAHTRAEGRCPHRLPPCLFPFLSLPPSLPPPNHLHVQVERKTWEVEKQKYKLENQQLMERLEATNRLVVKVQNKSSS